MGHEQETLNISIRVFRPEDLREVQNLYLETRIYGSGSPFRLAVSQYLLTPIAYTFYSIFFIGVCILLQNFGGYLRLLGAAFTLSSVVFVVGTGFPIGMFAYFGFRSVYQGDMKDVATHYRVRESQKEIAGASSFWVAKAETSGGEKIVGCIGLDCFSNDDPTQGELRRMFVSPAFRGHGIAKKLMNALLEHARNHDLKHVYLQTTGLNDKAVIMYQKTGWEMTKKHTFQAGFLKGEGYDFQFKLVDEET